MFGGDGAYVPHASSAIDMKLRLHEIVNVFDLGLVAHPARAILDSGTPIPIVKTSVYAFASSGPMCSSQRGHAAAG